MRFRPRCAGVASVGLLAVVAAAGCGTDDGGSQSSGTANVSDPVDASGSTPDNSESPEPEPTESPEPESTAAPVASTTTAAPTTSADPTTTLAPPPPALGWRTVEVVDPTRTTDEVLDGEGNVVVPAEAQRTIPVELLYPASDEGGENSAPADVEARPLIIWMHGLLSESFAGDPVLLNLFDAGYLVAAPNSPETTFPAGDASDPIEITEDLSTVIDALVDPSDGVADDLAAFIDGDRIGAGGHSLGSSTAVAAAFHDCCRDDRIHAVAASGYISGFDYGDADFVLDDTPLMMIVGEADDIAPETQARTLFDRSVGSAYLLTVDDLGHFDLTSSPGTPGGQAFNAGLAAFFDQHLAGVDDEPMARFADELSAGTLVIG
jgi:dienelactone hydrolase